MLKPYLHPGPTRDEIDSSSGLVVLEFGTDWCGYCQPAERIVAEALAAFTDVEHVKVEDGPGRRLGRSFGIKLWPTIVMLQRGEEVARVIRPQSVAVVISRLELLRGGGNTSGDTPNEVG
jgi:thioredoxin 1